jgi:cell division protein FtsI (penicillin-binding protein 3)
VNIKKSILLRTRLAFLAVVLFSFLIIYKMVKIQFIENDKWEKIAVENLYQYREVPATRGNIFSSDGSLLATSIPFYKVCLDPTIVSKEEFNKGIDSLGWLLSNFFKDKSAVEYVRKIRNARKLNERYLILSSKTINYQGKKTMSQWPIFRLGRMKGGVVFEKIEKRFRPFSFLARRTIGNINENNQGVGLEYSFNKELAGTNGKAWFRKMSGGNWRPVHNEQEVTPVDGIDIVTTIDINIQDVAESSLLNHLKKHDADYGCVILMEVQTGEIKAIANLGKVAPGEYLENNNYAMGNMGLTEPGSTFKLASIMALLEETDLLPTDSIQTGNGSYEFYDRVMRDSKPEGYGTITLQQAFEKSSNIAISRKVNEYFGAKPDKFIEYINRFGFNQPVSFQMEGVAKPYFKDPKSKAWSGTTLPWMSIGYELKVSPLQTLMFYNGVANNGKVVRPLLVKQSLIADQIIEEFKTETLVEELCSKETLEKVRRMLEGVVENGTAKNIKNPNYKIAGKTGTAQKLINQEYTHSYYTSFVGYFPADRPRYSGIVIIDNPKGFQTYGADVAAPVFKEIADKIYAQDLSIHAPFEFKPLTKFNYFPKIGGGLYEQNKFLCDALKIPHHSNATATDDWVKAKVENNTLVWEDRKILIGIVPDVKDLRLKDALYILENIGLKVVVRGAGRVVSQSILPGTRYQKGSLIEIVLN